MSNLFVILGYKLKKKSILSNILIKRLETCIKKYKKGDFIIVSGGNTGKMKHTEAYMMKKYLMEKGNIPEFFIVKENKSLSTKENIKYTENILKKTSNKKLLSLLRKTHKTHKTRKTSKNNIVFISQKIHLERVKKILNNNSFYNSLNIQFCSAH